MCEPNVRPCVDTRVAVQVNQARSEHAALCVDDRGSCGRSQPLSWCADLSDFAVLQDDIGVQRARLVAKQASPNGGLLDEDRRTRRRVRCCLELQRRVVLRDAASKRVENVSKPKERTIARWKRGSACRHSSSRCRTSGHPCGNTLKIKTQLQKSHFWAAMTPRMITGTRTSIAVKKRYLLRSMTLPEKHHQELDSQVASDLA